MSVSAGYFGKIPARGDFLRFRLPEAAIGTLDGWISRNLGAQQHRHGNGFDAIWERAPIWRFTLEPKRLDFGQAASGIWMPSIDRAGRCFPLLLVVLHPPDRSVDAILDALQPALQATVQWDAPPETLQAAIDEAVASQPPGGGRDPGDLWWRRSLSDGSPVLLRAALPEGDGFDLLLHLLPRELATLQQPGA